MVIEFDEVIKDFKFKGGCFKDGVAYHMKSAERNRIYKFSNVEIEVRNKKDPVIKAGELTNFNYNFGTGWVRIVTFIHF